MNVHLLKSEVQNYINANLKTDLHSLLLKKSPFPEVSMQEIVEQIKGRGVANKKFDFLLKKQIAFPKNLSLEQASSTETAIYKKQWLSGQNMIDLTAGLGIDAYYIGQNFENVTLVEQQKDLIEIVKHNWKILNRKATFLNDTLQNVIENTAIEYELIYLDPARRNENQQKVFLLEDLSPNILDILPQLLKIGKQIVIKLSPLIDISYLISEIKHIKEIHVIAVKNDVKELVVCIDKEEYHDVKIHTVNLSTEEPTFSFFWSQRTNTVEYAKPLNYLYIPNNALLKSGNFNGIAEAFQLKKLDANTHLYTSEDYKKDFPGRVLSVEQISSKEIKKGDYYNIISKNHPMKPHQIKKKYGLKDGGSQYLIFTQSKQKKIILKSCDKS